MNTCKRLLMFYKAHVKSVDENGILMRGADNKITGEWIHTDPRKNSRPMFFKKLKTPSYRFIDLQYFDNLYNRK